MNFQLSNESTCFEQLTQHELLLIDGGAEEDRKFGELVGNAFVGVVVETLPKMPFISNRIRSNARENIWNWYFN